MHAFPNPRRFSAEAYRSLFVASLCALAAVRALGLNPGHGIAQYGHTAWRIQDGAFTGAPNAISQTKDGYLWIGTQAGLVRFDGVNFTPFHPSAKERLRSPVIKSLLAARDGSLWIGTSGYLAHFKDGDLTSYLDAFGNIGAIRQDRSGDVWVSRSRVGDDARGALCKVVGAKLRCFGKVDGMPFDVAGPLLQGAGSDWWIARADQLDHWKDGASTLYAPEGLKALNGLEGYKSLTSAADGSLWAGMQQTGSGLGLQHLVGNAWKPFVTTEVDTSQLAVTALLFDRDKTLWIGTKDAGIYRINGNRVERFRASDGLSGDSINGFFEDREGDVWVATTKGVDKFRDARVVSFSKSDGLSADAVDSVVASRDGTVWLGNGVLDSIHGAEISSIKPNNGLPGRQVTSLMEDKAGRLWVGVDNKLFTLFRGKFTEIKTTKGGSVGSVERLVEDPDGTVWVEPICTPHKLIHVAEYKVIEEVEVPRKERAYAIAPDTEGRILANLSDGDVARYGNGKWEIVPLHRAPHTGIVFQFVKGQDERILGATTQGILGWKDGKVQPLATANDLPCNWIFSLIFDSQRTLWVYSRCGLISISNAELQRWWEHPDAKIKTHTFDILDGAQPAPPEFQSFSAMSPDGKLWFANSNVVQQIDPLHLLTNPVVPPVHIDRIVADKQEYPTQGSVSLPSLTREMQIDYTALSFVIPQRVRFRYKLEGWENSWQDAGTRRQAFYTNLRPATYRFHVIACNDDGLWNDVGDVLSFTIAPAYYQTRWFELLCIAVVAVILWLLYYVRLRQVTTKVQERLRAQMEERERIARELHDTLLQGFHGLMLRFQAITKILPKEGPAREMMGKVLDRADEVLLEGRESVRDLRATGSFTAELSAMLTFAGEELAQDTPIPFSVTVVGEPRTLDPVAHKESYRIGREALSNAFQHSHAAKIEVEMTYDNSGYCLRVRDNGSGIDNVVLSSGKQGHWGLSGMRERAKNLGALLNIWSKPGVGTEVEITVPAIVAYPQNSKLSIWRHIWSSTNRIEREG